MTDEQRQAFKDMVREIIREETSISISSERDYYSEGFKVELKMGNETISYDTFTLTHKPPY